MLDWEDLTEDEAKIGLQYLDDSRRISEAIENRGFNARVMSIEAKIAKFKARCIKKFGAQEAFGRPETQEQVLDRLRTAYQMSVERNGEEVSCLVEGGNLARELGTL
jgi:hypothetical protein